MGLLAFLCLALLLCNDQWIINGRAIEVHNHTPLDDEQTGSDKPLDDSTREKCHSSRKTAMQPANFLNVNYTMSTLEVKQFLKAERNGDPKAVQELSLIHI